MALYIDLLNDGSCITGEASSEAEDREEFLQRWDTSGTDKSPHYLRRRRVSRK
jgi:hypothetical protein